ncbi:hypothetical protein XENOCAPTIV_027681, partial [Xenoophorus captivus]
QNKPLSVEITKNSWHCKWKETGASYYLILNSCVEIQFVSDRASCEGRVCLEPLQRNVTELNESGRLVKFYEPYGFRALMHDLCTLRFYGCRLTPLFAQSSPPSMSQEDTC